MHAQTVDTRPFFLGWFMPGNEARPDWNLIGLDSFVGSDVYVCNYVQAIQVCSSIFTLPSASLVACVRTEELVMEDIAAWLLGSPNNRIAINLDEKTCSILWNHSVTVLLIVLINKLLV